MKYAHKKFLCSMNRAEEDGVLHTQFSSIPVKKDELVMTDEHGNSFIVTDKYFQENYLPVVKIDKGSMAEGYIAMGRINLEEANAGVHTYNDGLNELEKNDDEVASVINKIY